MTKFKKGDVIICINCESPSGFTYSTIHSGGVYTVADIFHGDVVLEKDDSGNTNRVFREHRFIHKPNNHFEEDLFQL